MNCIWNLDVTLRLVILRSNEWNQYNNMGFGYRCTLKFENSIIPNFMLNQVKRLSTVAITHMLRAKMMPKLITKMLANNTSIWKWDVVIFECLKSEVKYFHLIRFKSEWSSVHIIKTKSQFHESTMYLKNTLCSKIWRKWHKKNDRFQVQSRCNFKVLLLVDGLAILLVNVTQSRFCSIFADMRCWDCLKQWYFYLVRPLWHTLCGLGLIYNIKMYFFEWPGIRKFYHYEYQYLQHHR